VCDGDHICDLVKEARADRIFHCAGITNAPDVETLYRVNTVFAANLLMAAGRIKPRPRVMLAGSAAEYGPNTVDAPIPETHPCRPTTGYGISKLAQTLHGLAASEAGTPVVVARLFNVLGPGMPEHLALGNFARQIARMKGAGGVLRTGDLESIRDFVCVEDVARALPRLIESPQATGRVVNLCSGIPMRLRSLTESLVKASGAAIQIEMDPNRRRSSQPSSIVGDPTLSRELGIDLPAPDFEPLLAAMLR
jgi:GDP-4-dehydro-6-deoxy-D-mannose reductase